MFLGFSCSLAGKESTCNVGDLGSFPRLGRSHEEGKGYPLQYSGLENSMDCVDHGVAKSRTRSNHTEPPYSGMVRTAKIDWSDFQSVQRMLSGFGFSCTFKMFIIFGPHPLGGRRSPPHHMFTEPCSHTFPTTSLESRPPVSCAPRPHVARSCVTGSKFLVITSLHLHTPLPPARVRGSNA